MSFRIYTEPDENAFRVYADIDGETMWVGLVIWQVTKVWWALAFTTPSGPLKNCKFFATKGEAIEAVWQGWLDAQRDEVAA